MVLANPTHAPKRKEQCANNAVQALNMIPHFILNLCIVRGGGGRRRQ